MNWNRIVWVFLGAAIPAGILTIVLELQTARSSPEEFLWMLHAGFITPGIYLGITGLLYVFCAMALAGVCLAVIVEAVNEIASVRGYARDRFDRYGRRRISFRPNATWTIAIAAVVALAWASPALRGSLVRALHVPVTQAQRAMDLIPPPAFSARHLNMNVIRRETIDARGIHEGSIQTFEVLALNVVFFLLFILPTWIIVARRRREAKDSSSYSPPTYSPPASMPRARSEEPSSAAPLATPAHRPTPLATPATQTTTTERRFDQTPEQSFEENIRDVSPTRIDVLRGANAQTIRCALLLAYERFNRTDDITIEGDAEFVRQAVKAAAELHIAVSVANPELQKDLQKEKELVRATRATTPSIRQASRSPEERDRLGGTGLIMLPDNPSIEEIRECLMAVISKGQGVFLNGPWKFKLDALREAYLMRVSHSIANPDLRYLIRALDHSGLAVIPAPDKPVIFSDSVKTGNERRIFIDMMYVMGQGVSVILEGSPDFHADANHTACTCGFGHLIVNPNQETMQNLKRQQIEPTPITGINLEDISIPDVIKPPEF